MTVKNKDSITSRGDMTVGALVSECSHVRFLPETGIEAALSAMGQKGKRVGGVIDTSGKCLGIVTRAGLLGQLVVDQSLKTGHHGKPAAECGLSVADAMICNPAFLPSELGIADALAIMGEYGAQAMPVLSEGGKLVGIAELRDLTQARRMGHNTGMDEESAAEFLANMIYRDALGPRDHQRVK